MDNNEIKDVFKRLNIPTDNLPDYMNAEDYAKSFKKCSVLKEINVCYSSDSKPDNGYQNIQK